MSHLVMAVFQDRDQALAAVDALISEGAAPECIGLLAARPERFGQLHSPDVVESAAQPTSIRPGKGPFADPDDVHHYSGARTPGYGLCNLTELTVPKLGPVLVAGPLADALRASPAWPAERAISDALVRRGVDSSAARVVTEELHRGGIVLTVHDTATRHWEMVLERYGPVDLQP